MLCVIICTTVYCVTWCDTLKMVAEETETCLCVVTYDETHFADVHLVDHYTL